MKYIPRSIGPRFREYLKVFPAVMIWGPRQCGKSTFFAHELPHFEHFDLERPADYNLISTDPELFLTEHGDRVCIDEAQRYPELFPIMRHIIDKESHGYKVIFKPFWSESYRQSGFGCRQVDCFDSGRCSPTYTGSCSTSPCWPNLWSYLQPRSPTTSISSRECC
jgi:hypothetical protein